MGMGASGWGSLFKVSFKGRFLMAWMIITMAALYNALPQPFIRLIISIAFLPIAELFALTYTPFLVDIFVSMRGKIKWKPIPDWLAKISKEVGVKIKKFGIKEGLNNAYCIPGGTVVIGEKLYSRLTEDALIGVVGHELAHLKEKHGLKLALFVFLLLFLTGFSFSKLPLAMSLLAISAYLVIVMLPLNWWYEFRADALAAKWVGIERVKAALSSFEENINEPSETHPPIADRIKKLSSG